MKHDETTFGSLYTVSHFLRFFDSYTFQVLIHNFSPQTKNAKNHSMIIQQNNNKGMCQILMNFPTFSWYLFRSMRIHGRVFPIWRSTSIKSSVWRQIPTFSEFQKILVYCIAGIPIFCGKNIWKTERCEQNMKRCKDAGVSIFSFRFYLALCDRELVIIVMNDRNFRVKEIGT